MSGREIEEMNNSLEDFEECLSELRTMEYLTKRFNVDNRTVYRWITRLKEIGIVVVRVEDTYKKIVIN